MVLITRYKYIPLVCRLIQFGLRIADGGPDSSSVQLYYTDHRTDPSESQIIAEFAVQPPLAGSWNRLAMKVTDDQVTRNAMKSENYNSN